MKSRLLKLLFALLVAIVLASVALTFAQPNGLMAEKANMERHEQCEQQMERMEQMHRECTEMMNGMHHGEHKNFGNGHHGCH